MRRGMRTDPSVFTVTSPSHPPVAQRNAYMYTIYRASYPSSLLGDRSKKATHHHKTAPKLITGVMALSSVTTRQPYTAFKMPLTVPTDYPPACWLPAWGSTSCRGCVELSNTKQILGDPYNPPNGTGMQCTGKMALVGGKRLISSDTLAEFASESKSKMGN